MEYTIRKACPNDINAIIGLCGLHASYEQASYEATNKEAKLSKILFDENPKLQCLVVEIETQVMGYATFEKQYSTWEADFYVHLDCLFLKEPYRSLGIGENLVKKITGYAKEINAHHLEWQTPIFNHRAVKFYHKMGAVEKEKLRFTLNI